jgi:HAD superfamily hydrolase (TIGR01509 family)
MTQPAGRPNGFRAVLFDWRGTLVADPPDEWWVQRALERTGRPASPEIVAGWCDALRAAARLPEVVVAMATMDCSAAEHRASSLAYFHRAGLDDEFAEHLYALDFEAESHPFYADVHATLQALRERGCRIGLLSDIHVDLRPEFVAAGLDEYIDAYVLSFEHGVQKPDPRIFAIALDALGVAAAETLMVGDRASHDGAAVAVGITTLLLGGDASDLGPRDLHRVVALVG